MNDYCYQSLMKLDYFIFPHMHIFNDNILFILKNK